MSKPLICTLTPSIFDLVHTDDKKDERKRKERPKYRSYPLWDELIKTGKEFIKRHGVSGFGYKNPVFQNVCTEITGRKQTGDTVRHIIKAKIGIPKDVRSFEDVKRYVLIELEKEGVVVVRNGSNSSQSEIVIPRELRQDYSLLPDGHVTVSIRAMARLVGVAEKTLRKNFTLEAAGFLGSKLYQKLTQQGFEPAGFFEVGIDDRAAVYIIEYYAFDANRKTEQAKTLARCLIGTSFNLWVKKQLGFEVKIEKVESSPVPSEFIGQIDSRFDGVDSRLDKVESQLSSLGKNIVNSVDRFRDASELFNFFSPYNDILAKHPSPIDPLQNWDKAYYNDIRGISIDSPVVYMVLYKFRRGWTIWYIGKSTNTKGRFYNHNGIKALEANGLTDYVVLFLRVRNSSGLKKLEDWLTGQLGPLWERIPENVRPFILKGEPDPKTGKHLGLELDFSYC